MKSQLNLIGQWPIPGKEARRKKKMMIIKKGNSLDFIHGRDNHILVSFFVSNDLIHVGIMTIPAGSFSDLEEHRGDEVFFVIKGTVSVLVQEWEKERKGKAKSVSATRFEVRQGERFLVPEGYGHQYFNFGECSAEILFSTAPGL